MNRLLYIAFLLLYSSCTPSKLPDDISDPKGTYEIRYENLKDSQLRIEQLLGESKVDHRSISAYVEQAINDLAVMQRCIETKYRDGLSAHTSVLKQIQPEISRDVFTTTTISKLSSTFGQIRKDFAPESVQYIQSEPKSTQKSHETVTQPQPPTIHEWILLSSLQFHISKLIEGVEKGGKDVSSSDGRIKQLFEMLKRHQSEGKLSNYSDWYSSIAKSTEQFTKNLEANLIELKGLKKVIDEYSKNN
ncbi:MAG: hypothetical protein HY606_14650 [Planctomycetes bacterium]|nr:hypothetical protein [Planctomycetota bacterium]